MELAAEFKCIYPEKHVVLVDRHDKVVKRSFPGASTKIYNYLVKIGVEVRLEETVLTFNSKTNTYKTSKGEIKAEAIYLCTG